MNEQIQLPVHGGRRPYGSQVDLAGKRWRKQVLPAGQVKYGGGVLDFSKDVLKKIATNFKKRPFDQIPLVLADRKNRHNEDPKNYAGVVTDMSVDDNGLYIEGELNDLGENVVRNAPWIGTSVRYFKNFVRGHDATEFGPVVRHICLTGDPHVTGMAEGEILMSGETPGDVTDLTAAHYQRGAEMQEYKGFPSYAEFREACEAKAVELARDLLHTTVSQKAQFMHNCRARIPDEADWQEFMTDMGTAFRDLSTKQRQVAGGVARSLLASTPKQAQQTLDSLRSDVTAEAYQDFWEAVKSEVRSLGASVAQSKLSPHEQHNVQRTAAHIGTAARAGRPSARTMLELASNAPRTAATAPESSPEYAQVLNQLGIAPENRKGRRG